MNINCIKTKQKFLDKTPHRDWSIDFLKFICMILIVFVHTRIPNGYPSWIYNKSVCCQLGVALFFLLSGYTWYFSSEKQTNKSIANLHKLYNPFYLIKKFLRFFIPWFFMFAIWQTALGIMNHSFNAGQFFTYFFLCGKPTNWFGSYFVFIMYEMLIFYPLIYLLIKKYGLKGMMAIYIFLIFFELFVASIKVPDIVYWYLGPRAAAYIGFGAYLAQTKDKIFSFKNLKLDLILFFSLAVGIVSVTLLCQFTTPSTRWIFPYSNTCLTTGILGSLFGLPIAYVYIKKIHIKQPWLGFIGSKTYSIMMFQMIYFSLTPYMWAANNLWLQAFVDILLCFSGGIIYYYIFEKSISSTIINKLSSWYINKKNNS